MALTDILPVRKEEHAEKMREFKKRTTCKDDVFRIAVCGKFKTGKTSLLNLLLGLDLPVMAVTATGVVTKIVFGTPVCAEFQDGSRRRISQSELVRYITVTGKDLYGSGHSEAVAVYVPCGCPIMMNGKVEFWDTPGLEDDRHLTELTMNAVEKCDLAVLVMDAAKILSQQEKLFLYRMQEQLGGNVLVVLNRWDMLRADEKAEVRKTAGKFLKPFGSDLAGYGRFLTTSANPDAADITSLRNKLYDICEDEKLRARYKSRARSAGISFFAREWREELEQDIQSLETCLEECRKDAAGRQDKRAKELEQRFLEKKARIKGRLTEILYKVDDRSYWTEALQAVKNTENWEKKYVSLSSETMKKALQDIYREAREAVEEMFDRQEFPERYQPPELSEEKVWRGMAWGTDYEDTHVGGMLAGAAAGAAAGSAFLGIGAIPGLAVGLIAGALRDGKKDEADKAAFQNNCFNRTLTAFYQGPAGYAKKEIQKYTDGILDGLEKGAALKRSQIKETDETRAEYDAGLEVLKDLKKYRKALEDAGGTALS